MCVCSVLVHRANEWLARHSAVHVVDVEVIEISGVYGAGSGCVQSVKNVSQTALPAYLRMLRYRYISVVTAVLYFVFRNRTLL